MRFILVGTGRVGLAILETREPTDDVTVIDARADRVERVRERHPGVRVIEGDATSEDVLLSAGVAQADAVITTAREDPTNLMIATHARRLGVPNVVTRVTSEDVVPLFTDIGAVPVPNPSNLTAEHLYHAFLTPGVRAFMTVGEDAEVVTLSLNPRSRLANRPVREARFPRGALLIAVNREGRLMVPTADLTLRPGDVLTMIAPTYGLERLMGRILGLPARQFTERVRRLIMR